jgi:hypothetical protein
MNFENLKKKPISSGLVPWVQNPLKIHEKNSKKNFFWYLSKWYLVPGTTVEKKN